MVGPGGIGQSFWVETAAQAPTAHPPLSADLDVDVAVVGGGIVGLTAAEMLKRAGKSVVVLEARRIGRQVTGRSTAKVTSQHSLIYEQLIRNFGEDGARIYGEANEYAIGRIAELVAELGIDCDFHRKSAYVYARTDEHVEAVERETEAARKLGLPAAFVRETSLPFQIAGAMRFDRQAQFNPSAYLLGLAKSVADGGKIFEGTRVVDVEEGEPCLVHTENGPIVRAADVIVATHLPIGKIGMLFARAYPYSRPIVAAQIDAAKAPEGMFISAGEPTHSITVAWAPDATYLVCGGQSYKPGETEEEAKSVEDLERFVRSEFGVDAIQYRWTNEDYNSMDGVPFIGRTSPAAQHLFTATGFNAWGLTTGTVAAIILSDLIREVANSWAEVFDPSRAKPIAGGSTFISENVTTATHLVRDRYMTSRPGSIDAVAPGQAAVLELDGEQVAVHRDPNGSLHAVSAVCPHMGCIVGWNATDQTWDCPCHGSRFEREGAVIHGPAISPLEKKSIAGP